MRTVAPGNKRGYMLIPSRASIWMATKRSHWSRSLSSAGRNLRRKFFLNLMISLTFMLISSGSVAAMLASTIRTFWNSSSPGGGMLARLLISDGSSKSKTDRRSTFRTLSIPSMDRPRLRLRKLEI